jgi:peptide/nickel transport system substrate-binding protein
MKEAWRIGLLIAVVVLSFFVATGIGAQGKYKESPMLTALVKAGKLPPVDRRLPKEPFVVGPSVLIREKDLRFEVGKYGGTMNLVRTTPTWAPSVFVQCNEPILAAPSLDVEPIRGNIVRDYKVSNDNRVFTFYMRDGLKWSDGSPVTTEDVLFAYEDVLLNEKLTPVFPSWLKSGNTGSGDPFKLEIIDKYKFRISFSKPYGGFPAQLAINDWRDYSNLLKPKHYLKQFHIRYVPLKDLEPLIAKQGLSAGEWWTLFKAKDFYQWENTPDSVIGCPTLMAWVLVEDKKGTLMLERNPYYFKVDTAGNQLPYIDRLKDTLLADVKMVTMKMLSGEADHSYEYGVLSDLPLYKENAEKGNYIVKLYDVHYSIADVWLNFTYQDPIWRQFLRDVRFRQALNMGINRKEIIETVYYGFAEPSVTVPSTYDPEQAKQILDNLGLKKRDGEGWRLRPDGERFIIPIEFSPDYPQFLPVAEIVAENWKALGVYTTVKQIERGLLMKRRNANELFATMRYHQGSVDVLWDAYTQIEYWAPLWNIWFQSGGKNGEEPPEDVKKLQGLVDSVLLSPPKDMAKIDAEIQKLYYDNIYIFTPVERMKCPVLANKNLGNVADSGIGIAAQFAAEQYFFRK